MVISAISKGMSNYLMVYENRTVGYESFRQNGTSGGACYPAVYVGEREIQNYSEKYLQEGEPYEERMLISNTFQELVPFSVQSINGKKRYLYRVDGMTGMEERFSRFGPGREELIVFLRSLESCLLELEEYMLKPENLFLSLDSILYQKEEDRYSFLYIPGYEENFGQSLRKIIESFMRLYDHSKKSEVLFLYDLYSKLLNDNFTAKTFCELVDALPKDEDGTNYGNDNKRYEEEPDACERGVCKRNDHSSKKAASDQSDSVRESEISIFPFLVFLLLGAALTLLLGKTGLRISGIIGGGMVLYYLYRFLSIRQEQDLEDEGRVGTACDEERINVEEKTYEYNAPLEDEEVLTQILRDGEVSVSQLISENGRTPIIFLRDEIRIGREKSENDYSIEIPEISRRHALIRKVSPSEICVIDLGSTNGTYVNAAKLEKNKAVVLRYGDRVLFGTQGYRCM